jgi:hypothetical protein
MDTRDTMDTTGSGKPPPIFTCVLSLISIQFEDFAAVSEALAASTVRLKHQ